MEGEKPTCLIIWEEFSLVALKKVDRVLGLWVGLPVFWIHGSPRWLRTPRRWHVVGPKRWLMPIWGRRRHFLPYRRQCAPTSQEKSLGPHRIGQFSSSIQSSFLGKVVERLAYSYKGAWMKQIIWTIFSPATSRALIQHLLVTSGRLGMNLLVTSGKFGMKAVQLFWPSWTFQWLSIPLTSCSSGTASEVGNVRHNVMVVLLLPPWLVSVGRRREVKS